MLSFLYATARLHGFRRAHGAATYITRTAQWHRAFHHATARFTTIDSSGAPISNATDIKIGDAHEAYVYIDPSVGDATKSAIAQLLGTLKPKEDAVEKLPLKFYHKSRHFAHESLPLPRVELDRDLPKQASSDGDTTPATLWLSGLWHAITLDGSPDEWFERESRNSARELKGTLDLLKDN
ncbi:hypothetical protein SEPCBS119000_003897 [Sporothrix epigloea]|uniref:Uncharacterized protein n=1 Tax=Sporothrix epigloea TaxID=1892477 RepID=A0ABP0DP51_9PEZI